MRVVLRKYDCSSGNSLTYSLPFYSVRAENVRRPTGRSIGRSAGRINEATPPYQKILPNSNSTSTLGMAETQCISISTGTKLCFNIKTTYPITSSTLISSRFTSRRLHHPETSILNPPRRFRTTI